VEVQECALTRDGAARGQIQCAQIEPGRGGHENRRARTQQPPVQPQRLQLAPAPAEETLEQHALLLELRKLCAPIDPKAIRQRGSGVAQAREQRRAVTGLTHQRRLDDFQVHGAWYRTRGSKLH
jgi:hypothetical protein